jgi:hypothetical protein
VSPFPIFAEAVPAVVVQFVKEANLNNAQPMKLVIMI